MPSEKQISCVADAIDFALGDIKKARLFVDRIELIKDVVRTALTADEQATDAEREFNEVLKGAQEFNDALPERMRRNGRDWLRPDDEPAADAEPVAWRFWSNSRPGGITTKKDMADWYRQQGWNVDALYTRPPESRLREALEEISRLQAGRSGHGVWRAVKIARAALAQEDGR